jgi:hypothetical protein
MAGKRGRLARAFCVKGRRFAAPPLASPSRHIYSELTTESAFRRSGAFDAFWQHRIKVDGTFA